VLMDISTSRPPPTKAPITNTTWGFDRGYRRHDLALILAVPRRLVEGVSAIQEGNSPAGAQLMLGTAASQAAALSDGPHLLGARRAKAFGLPDSLPQPHKWAAEIEQELKPLLTAWTDAGAHGLVLVTAHPTPATFHLFRRARLS